MTITMMGRMMRGAAGLIGTILLLVSQAIPAATNSECVMLTTTPQSLQGRVVVSESMADAMPIVLPKGGGYFKFRDAHDTFMRKLREAIEESCATGKVSGAVNISIKFFVDANWYYFTAGFDYIK